MTTYDPVPAPLTGDPGVVSARAGVLSRTAEALRDAARELQALSSQTVTISQAVDEIRTKGTEASGDISRVEIRYQGAADAMTTYGSSLSNAQQRAEAARQRIQDNNSTASYWRRREDTLREQAMYGESTPELLEDLQDAQRRVRLFEAEFTSAMNEYYAAEADKRDAVTAAVDALQHASDASGVNDSIWDYIGAGLEILYEWAQEHLAPLIEQLRGILELLKSIIDILSLVVGILALFLPFLAPLAAALTLASVALSAAILLCSLALVLLGRESLGRLLSDVIGLATSVITARMGGLNVFSPGSSLAGLGAVFTRTAWTSGVSTLRLGFTFSSAVMGTGETVAGMGLEVLDSMFNGSTLVGLGGDILGGLTEGGLNDMTLDFFPEGGSSDSFVSVEGGGWDLSGQEIIDGVAEPVANVLSGGVSGPVISVVRSVDTVFFGGS